MVEDKISRIQNENSFYKWIQTYKDARAATEAIKLIFGKFWCGIFYLYS